MQLKKNNTANEKKNLLQLKKLLTGKKNSIATEQLKKEKEAATSKQRNAEIKQLNNWQIVKLQGVISCT